MSRHLPVLQAWLISFEARLDAALRRVEAPGQLALDLTGGSRGGGGELITRSIRSVPKANPLTKKRAAELVQMLYTGL